MAKTTALKQNQFAHWLFHLDRILRGEATSDVGFLAGSDLRILHGRFRTGKRF